MCTPNGGTCVAFSDCCSNTCSAGICSAQCEQNGSSCTDPSQCCDGQCNGGVCGPPTCPVGGNACEDCLGANCCGQALMCLDTPMCATALECIFACAEQGTVPLPACFGQCGAPPQVIPLALCANNSCAGICF
jgi:hypothetical protein